MKTILILTLLLAFALSAIACGDAAEAAKSAPKPPETGREAMRVDGQKPGRLEKQDNGTYLLRYPDKTADKVSANEVVLMPEGK